MESNWSSRQNKCFMYLERRQKSRQHRWPLGTVRCILNALTFFPFTQSFFGLWITSDGRICDGCWWEEQQKSICVFFSLPSFSEGCHGHHLHKVDKGTSTALIPSLCTFPLLKTVRNFHLGSESADRTQDARFLSADGRFEGFWRPCMKLIFLTVVVSQSARERHQASFTVNG